jgi:hypothetical protein
METFFSGGSKPFVPEPKEDKPKFVAPTKVFNPQEKLDPRSGLVKSWSFSALSTFEKCQHQIKLSRVDGIPQESGPAAERGNRIHQHIEDFIKGESEELSADVKYFHSLIENLRYEYADAKVMVEDEWAYGTEWESAEYRSRDAWCRMKLDALHWESETCAIAYDWKTGKKFGNEFKHSQQGQLYAIGTFLLFPNAEHVTVKFIYVDQNDTLEKTYTRDEAMLFLPSWTKRGVRMTQTTEFIPSPSIHTCRWCPYKEEACEWSEK